MKIKRQKKITNNDGHNNWWFRFHDASVTIDVAALQTYHHRLTDWCQCIESSEFVTQTIDSKVFEQELAKTAKKR